MSKPATGTVEWVPPTKGETQGHYKGRVTCIDGSRPWIHFEPGPRSEQAKARAKERAAANSAEMRKRRIVGVPQRSSPKARPRKSSADAETVAAYAERWLADRAKRGRTGIGTDR